MGNCSLSGEAGQKRKTLSREASARNVKTKTTAEEKMSLPNKRNEEPIAQNQAPMELRSLALLELKRRRLQKELSEVESQHRKLSREIELKRIPIPWLRPLGAVIGKAFSELERKCIHR